MFQYDTCTFQLLVFTHSLTHSLTHTAGDWSRSALLVVAQLVARLRRGHRVGVLAAYCHGRSQGLICTDGKWSNIPALVVYIYVEGIMSDSIPFFLPLPLVEGS